MSGAIRFYLELALQRLVDFIYAAIPRPRPNREALINCKIIAHRGVFDNDRVQENTRAAFDAAVAAGVWGIEFDVRWTRDYEPVVIHDPDCRRVFGQDLVVADSEFAALRRAVPQVPSLAEVVARYGGGTHMMIELKLDTMASIERKRDRLTQVFADLVPAQDFHMLALEMDLFAPADAFGDRACIPVAELNVGALSRATLCREFAGFGGQYLLLNKSLIERHRLRRQKIGTGFIDSRFCFYRELNRGVDWIFTNAAVKLCRLRQRLLDAG